MNIYFTIFEILVFCLFGLCLRNAFREGWLSVLRLIAGIVYGILLELATIKQLDSYSYGHFLIMVDTVPVAVGVGWGIILYSAMLFSNNTKLPWFLRPILDALLALNIDLAMDAIAIRLGMWDWGKGFKYEYFGVPLANFWAWFWVVFSFSLAFRIFDKIKSKIKILLAPFMAVILGLIGVLSTNLVITKLFPEKYNWIAITLIVIISLGILFLQRNKLVRIKPFPILAFWIPFAFHIFFILSGIISGVIFQPYILFMVSLLMLAISFMIHREKTVEKSNEEIKITSYIN